MTGKRIESGVLFMVNKSEVLKEQINVISHSISTSAASIRATSAGVGLFLDELIEGYLLAKKQGILSSSLPEDTTLLIKKNLKNIEQSAIDVSALLMDIKKILSSWEDL